MPNPHHRFASLRAAAMRAALVCSLGAPSALLMTPPPALAQEQQTAALINEALDKTVQLDLAGTLPQAMAKIESETGVPIEATPDVWRLLPWGQDTSVTAKIQNQTLRQALTELCQRLGLRFELRDQALVLLPQAALLRLGRRATLPELQALHELASTSLDLAKPHPTVQQVIEAIDARLAAGKSKFKIDFRPGDKLKQDQSIEMPRDVTLAKALDVLDAQTPLTWCPWGRSIVVQTKEAQVRDQLAKTITQRFNGADVTDVLQALQKQAGVDFSIEPGAIQRIAPEFRTVRLTLDNATIRQALESLSGFTGLSYQVNDKGVYIYNESAAANNNANGGSHDPVVALLQLPDGLELMIHQSQVPEDLRPYLKEQVDREMDGLRAAMNRQPATNPSTVPTTRP